MGRIEVLCILLWPGQLPAAVISAAIPLLLPPTATAVVPLPPLVLASVVAAGWPLLMILKLPLLLSGGVMPRRRQLPALRPVLTLAAASSRVVLTAPLVAVIVVAAEILERGKTLGGPELLLLCGRIAVAEPVAQVSAWRRRHKAGPRVPRRLRHLGQLVLVPGPDFDVGGIRKAGGVRVVVVGVIMAAPPSGQKVYQKMREIITDLFPYSQPKSIRLIAPSA